MIGKNTRCGRIENATADNKLLAIYSPWSLGAKGQIYGRNELDMASYLGAVPTLTVNGVGYHLVEYCSDYAQLMRRFHWYTENKASAYCQN